MIDGLEQRLIELKRLQNTCPVTVIEVSSAVVVRK